MSIVLTSGVNKNVKVVGIGNRVLLTLPPSGVQFGKGLDSAVGQGPRPPERPAAPADRSPRPPAYLQRRETGKTSCVKQKTRGAVRLGRRLSVPHHLCTERKTSPETAQ